MYRRCFRHTHALQRMVHHVAGKDRMVVFRAEIDADLARRMTERGRQPDAVLQLEIRVDQAGLTGFDNRQAAVFPDGGAALVAFRRGGIGFPGFVFFLAEDIGRVGERRYPFAVD